MSEIDRLIDAATALVSLRRSEVEGAPAVKSLDEYERIVYGEVLVPETLNVYGDWQTRATIRQAVELFAAKGYILDVEHDQVPRGKDELIVVESFIARDGDDTFIPGSWVVGVKVLSDELWAAVVSGEINGFSYLAEARVSEIDIPDPGTRIVSGVTEPDLTDGHTHEFIVVVDSLGRVLSGGTESTDGHAHVIRTHTVTDVADGHKHRFNIHGENNE